jgi:hypothetical protein
MNSPKNAHFKKSSGAVTEPDQGGGRGGSNNSVMYALSRDPETIFTYWEIDPLALTRLRKRMEVSAFERSKRALRLLDVSDIHYNGSNAWQTEDIEIPDSASSYYVRVPEQGRTYMLEYGVIDAGGAFFKIVRSNSCLTPRKGVSDQQDKAWSAVHSDKLIRASTDAMNGDIDASQSLDAFITGLGSGAVSGGIA